LRVLNESFLRRLMNRRSRRDIVDVDFSPAGQSGSILDIIPQIEAPQNGLHEVLGDVEDKCQVVLVSLPELGHATPLWRLGCYHAESGHICKFIIPAALLKDWPEHFVCHTHGQMNKRMSIVSVENVGNAQLTGDKSKTFQAYSRALLALPPYSDHIVVHD